MRVNVPPVDVGALAGPFGGLSVGAVVMEVDPAPDEGMDQS